MARSRSGVLWTGVILSAIVLIFLLIFIVQNNEPVQITFLGASGTLPTGVALLFAAIAGLLLVAIPGGLRIMQLRRAARRTPRADVLRIADRPLPVVGRARMYVCGITPYDTTHLGHAATFVWADVAARVLRHLGVEVEVCRNVTDVDDVLDAAAARSGARPDSFAAVQQFRFDRDMTVLGVRRPTPEPRAHNHIGQVVTLAAALLEVGAAYRPAARCGSAGRGSRRGPAWTSPRRPRWPPSSGREPMRGPRTRPTCRSGGRARRRGGWPSPWGEGGRAGTPSARRWR